MASSSRPHVAVAAFPFGSHAALLFSLARALAAEASGASFTFLSTGPSLASLRAAGAGCPANLRMVEVADGLPPGGVQPPVPRQMELFSNAAAAGGLSEGLEAARAAAGGAGVTCVVGDAFLWMAGEAASAAGARWVPVWTAASGALLAHLHTDALREAIGDEATSRADDLLTSFPGLGSYRVRDLPDGVVFGDFDYIIFRLVHRMGKCLPSATAVALNTFPGLDPPDVAAALAAAFPDCLPIGPFHLLSSADAKPAVSDPHGCLAWLDRHAARTVAYVSFGTVASPQPDELRELASGLEASGSPFLWSLKEAAWPLLPPGFLDRNREVGLVVGWAPQVDVLRHAATGAFVTHAGWSSVLEAITSGVPMACRPFFGDQGMNARSVGHVLEVGAVFDGGAMTRDSVVKALDVLLKEAEGKKMRARAQELQATVVEAFAPNGRGRKNFEKLVKIVAGSE